MQIVDELLEAWVSLQPELLFGELGIDGIMRGFMAKCLRITTRRVFTASALFSFDAQGRVRELCDAP